MAHTIAIFGASGDLTSRKLIPALYQLHRKGRLPEPTRIVGFSRTEFSDETWRDQLAQSTAGFAGDQFDTESWNAFAPSVFYHRGDINRSEDFASLAQRLAKLEDEAEPIRVYYLSTAPQFYELALSLIHI